MYNLDDILAMNRYRLFLYAKQLWLELEYRLSLRRVWTSSDPEMRALDELDWYISHILTASWVDGFNAVMAAHDALRTEVDE